MSNHFYTKTGEFIEGGLREARKVGGLPSVSTALDVLGGDALKRYFQRQMWEATATTPRHAGMDDEAYYGVCLAAANEHAERARAFGNAVHAAVEQWLKTGVVSAEGPTSLALARYIGWHKENVKRSIAVEAPILGEGYGGRVDHVAELKDGSIACLDVKTQDLAKRTLKDGTLRPNLYLKWALQLAGYVRGIAVDPEKRWHSANEPKLISIVIGSDDPMKFYAHEWPQSVAFYYRIFMALLDLWCEEARYWPSKAATTTEEALTKAGL